MKIRSRCLNEIFLSTSILTRYDPPTTVPPTVLESRPISENPHVSVLCGQRKRPHGPQDRPLPVLIRLRDSHRRLNKTVPTCQRLDKGDTHRVEGWTLDRLVGNIGSKTRMDSLGMSEVPNTLEIKYLSSFPRVSPIH